MTAGKTRLAPLDGIRGVAILLVVLVSFLFLRRLGATIIPSVTVPLALLGTCGLM